MNESERMEERTELLRRVPVCSPGGKWSEWEGERGSGWAGVSENSFGGVVGTVEKM